MGIPSVDTMTSVGYAHKPSDSSAVTIQMTATMLLRLLRSGEEDRAEPARSNALTGRSFEALFFELNP